MSWEIRLSRLKYMPASYDVQAVIGMLKRDGKILVGQRPLGKPYSGYWEFPGGKIEVNELSIEALKRELDEELGIQVISASPWFQHAHTYPDKTVLLDIWIVETFLGEPHSKENQALQWATWQEITALRLLEGNRPIMDKIEDLFLRGEDSSQTTS